MTPLMADQPSGAGGPSRRSSVNARLTPNRRRRPVENDEYASFIRRVIRAHARRLAAGDVDALVDMTELATDLDEAISPGRHRAAGGRVLVGRDRGPARRLTPGSTAAMGPAAVATGQPSRAPVVPPNGHQQPMITGCDSPRPQGRLPYFCPQLTRGQARNA